DTGMGISAENLGKLFMEFQQLDAGEARQSQGSGLGLALTKQIVEAHGGRVEVRSVAGEGSTFSAIVPRVMTCELVPACPPANQTAVLVIESDTRERSWL